MTLKVYAEATKGEEYGIVVHNRLDRRVGVVLAVDGRNIISGKQSWLKNNERMYILEPNQTSEFKGWRTSSDLVNRFYFTTTADSYTAAFDDVSAMGVIAMAVYPEVRREPVAVTRGPQRSAPQMKAGGTVAGSSRFQDTLSEISSQSAGTGYGREEYSPVRTVAFVAEKIALEKVYIKYEWRETLCSKGIIACNMPHREPYNRMWNDGYAPPPPARIDG